MGSYYIYIIIALFGLAIGSFLNVLIYRIPLKKGFVAGRSFCPKCQAPIRFYDNIPLLSWIVLGGKCRNCKARISFRYPAVELLNAFSYVFFFWRYGLTAEGAIFCFLASSLIVIFFIDLDHQIIPDIITLPGIVLGLGISFLPEGLTFRQSLIGLLVGGGGLYLVALLGDWIFKKESMGGGDIKMTAMLGAFLGWQKIVFIFFASAFIGLVVSIIWMAFSKKVRSSRMIPFGPFIAIAAVVAILYGEKLIAFYINTFWIS